MRTGALVGIFFALLGLTVQLFMMTRALQRVERPAPVAGTQHKEHDI